MSHVLDEVDYCCDKCNVGLTLLSHKDNQNLGCKNCEVGGLRVLVYALQFSLLRTAYFFGINFKGLKIINNYTLCIYYSV